MPKLRCTRENGYRAGGGTAGWAKGEVREVTEAEAKYLLTTGVFEAVTLSKPVVERALDEADEKPFGAKHK